MHAKCIYIYIYIYIYVCLIHHVWTLTLQSKDGIWKGLTKQKGAILFFFKIKLVPKWLRENVGAKVETPHIKLTLKLSEWN